MLGSEFTSCLCPVCSSQRAGGISPQQYTASVLTSSVVYHSSAGIFLTKVDIAQ